MKRELYLNKNKYIFESLSYFNIITYIKLSILIYDETVNNNNNLKNLFEQISFDKLNKSFDFFLSLDKKNINYKKFDYLIKPQLSKIIIWWSSNNNKTDLMFNNYLIRIYFLYIRVSYGYYHKINPIF